MGAKDDWFRSSRWDKNDQQIFEEKVAKTRDRSSRAQYLRIKGGSLQESSDPKVRAIGRQLYQQVIDEYSDQKGGVALALQSLGDAFKREGDVEKSEDAYKKCIDYYYTYLTKSGTTIQCELDLAELIVNNHQKTRYNEAEELLRKWITRYGHGLFNSQIYRYSVISARLGVTLGQPAAAATFAAKALQAASDGQQPQLTRHPTVGLVKADPEELKEMTDIVKGKQTHS